MSLILRVTKRRPEQEVSGLDPRMPRSFEEIKRHLMNPPVLSEAKPGEPLSLYIAAGPKAVSSALVREEGGMQSPIYYVSQVLKDTETRYPNLEKFALALVHFSRKLRQYFQGREIRVVTDQQLRKIIHKPGASGRLVNWAIELGQFNINFVPQTAIKAQALAEFVMECTFPEPQPLASHEIAQKEANPGTDCWKLYIDGTSTAERSGAGLILIIPEGFTIQEAITFIFKATNNQAEYEAFISGLKLAKSLGISKMIIYIDSQIVVKQTSGEYIVKDPTLAQYQAMVRNILEATPDITILQINREENSKADELSKLVQNTSDLASSVYFEELKAPSTERAEVLYIGSSDNWTTPYIAYLRDGTLPEDQYKARYLKHKAARFFLEDGKWTVEVTNRTILRGLEKRLEESKKTWPDELPKVLQSYGTTPKTGTNETPFKLAYGTEARIPVETGSPSHRFINFDEISNIEGLKTKLELLDEVRDKAVKRMESYKEKTKLYFAKKAKTREYKAGDLVLQHTEASDPTNQGKLQPNWESPYMVKEGLRPETYKLSYLGGTEVPNTWPGARLRKLYQ
ncbi:uncharacterized protein LOC141691883 [Apium graveolens]|uniref:uncharacterized protein LOC141691883 n=1 Tax=Apium graveolens TaxID=4045 RepID=UPI003D7BA285